MKLLRNAAATVCASAAIVTCITAPANAISTTARQQWGPWTEVGYTYSIKCRTYVDASPSGSKIYITGAVYCNRKAEVAMDLSAISSGTKSKLCKNVTKSHFCYLSRWIKNPHGKQTFRVSTTANHIGHNIKAAHIKFKA
ncbi:hypothetical protein [Actinoallomurus sp. CA-150999]|uniref:hypothetical protein n=1 Tax=Actinoallomurus sp. CA-150999 TaxID=3239887 RepID=UPI003D91ECB7